MMQKLDKKHLIVYTLINKCDTSNRVSYFSLKSEAPSFAAGASSSAKRDFRAIQILEDFK